MGPIIGVIAVLGVAVLAFRWIGTMRQMGEAQNDVVEAVNQWMPDLFPKFGTKSGPFDKVGNVSFTNSSFFSVPDQLTFEHWYMHAGGGMKDRAGFVKGTYNRVTREIDMTCTFQENRGEYTVKARMPDFRGTRTPTTSTRATAHAADTPATPGAAPAEAKPTAPDPAGPAKTAPPKAAADAKPKSEGSGEGGPPYVVPYFIVILAAGLGLAVVLNPSKRRERDRPERFGE